jgi:hypothetical protein
MGIFKMRAGEHVVRDTDFARFLRRQLNDETLFTGYNLKAQRWFLGMWVRKDQGYASDIADLGADMELASRSLVKDLERSRDGLTAADIKRNLVRADRRAVDLERQEAEEFQEVQNWAQKKSGSTVPVLMG